MTETELTMLERLRTYYSTRSQGDGTRYSVAWHVRSGAGFGDAYRVRTADAVVMDLWPSAGLLLHGFEVKVSRSDWLAELQDPAKCEGVRRYMDRWWLVVPAAPRTYVREGELPDGWGLMYASNQVRRVWDPARRAFGDRECLSLRVAKQAPRLTPEPVGRSFMAALLRATAKTAARTK